MKHITTLLKAHTSTVGPLCLLMKLWQISLDFPSSWFQCNMYLTVSITLAPMRKYYVKQFSNYTFLTVITYVHLLESAIFHLSCQLRWMALHLFTSRLWQKQMKKGCEKASQWTRLLSWNSVWLKPPRARLGERQPSGTPAFDWHIVKQWCSLTNFK